MEYFRGLPFPVAATVLFVIVVLRAGGTYALGRAAHVGAERTRLKRMLDSPKFARAQRLVARWGAPVVAASFLTVGVQTLVNLAAGVTRMPLRRYLPALAVGGLLWALLYAAIGLLTFSALRDLYDVSPAAAIGIGLTLVAGLVGYIVWQLKRTDDPAAEDAAAASERDRLAARD